MKKLVDRTAVVTGAASGIGRATAVRLARRGCRLALADLDADGLAETGRMVAAAGARHSEHVLDVADRAAMLALPDAVLAEHGAAHLLLNNAGVTVTKAFHEHTMDDFDWVVGVNLWGVVHGCHAFLPHLMRVDEAHIVNVSSIFGIIGVPSQTSYCATKYAVRGFTEALAEELHGTHVQVSCVHPGGVGTNIIENARTRDAEMKSQMAGFFRTRTISPDAAAAVIVRGIEADRRRILITREAYLLDAVKRLLPTLGNRAAIRSMMRMMGVSGKLDEAQRDALAAARQDPR